MKATVIALNGCKLAGLVAREVFLLDDPAARATGLDDGRRRLALVEAVNAMPSDQTQRVCKVKLHQPLTGFKWLPFVEENFAGRRKFPEIVGRRGEHVDVALVQRESVFGEFDRRFDQS